MDHAKCDEQMTIATESVNDPAVEEPSPFQKRRRVDKNVCGDEACKSQPKISREAMTTRGDILVHLDDDDNDDDDDDDDDDNDNNDTDDGKDEMNSTIADDDETEANISNRELEEVMQDVVRKRYMELFTYMHFSPSNNYCDTTSVLALAAKKLSKWD